MEKPTKTVRISAGTRIYYFDVHKDKKGQPYISISEVPVDRNPGKKERQRVFVHTEDIDKFADAFAEIIKYVKSQSPAK